MNRWVPSKQVLLLQGILLSSILLLLVIWRWNDHHELPKITKLELVLIKEKESADLHSFPDEPDISLSHFPANLYKEQPANISQIKHLKKILFWNKVNGYAHFEVGYGQLPFIKAGCRYQNCYTTSNRALFPLQDLDALLWNYFDKDKTLPTKRYPHTKYGFYNMEPPSHSRMKLAKYKKVFNFTIGYRLDANVTRPYGIVVKRKTVDESYLSLGSTTFSLKSKMAAWFVSNCKAESMRNRLTKTLQNYIKVDVYGKCGPFKCPKSNETKCFQMIEKEYLFYLSFENELCKDYVTEKLFKLLEYNIVPVVYGLGPYDKHVPPHSYIDVFDFPSVKSLAEYLIYLSNNMTAYNEYFRWKSFYMQLQSWSKRIFFICKLCEVVNNNSSSRIINVFNWYIRKAGCKSSTDLYVSNFVKGKEEKFSYNEMMRLNNKKNQIVTTEDYNNS